jgi:hypothetical protein
MRCREEKTRDRQTRQTDGQTNRQTGREELKIRVERERERQRQIGENRHIEGGEIHADTQTDR